MHKTIQQIIIWLLLWYDESSIIFSMQSIGKISYSKHLAFSVKIGIRCCLSDYAQPLTAHFSERDSCLNRCLMP